MKVHAIISQSNGVISITLQALFVGDQQDASDKQKIAAFGDPMVNIAGTFTDPSNTSFVFAFPTTELWVGITTQMSSYTARFMVALPSVQNPNQPSPVQGPLDCVTPNPSEACQAWANIITSAGTGRIAQAMSTLRSNTVVPTINDTTV
jgi:hypothetical protein